VIDIASASFSSSIADSTLLSTLPRRAVEEYRADLIGCPALVLRSWCRSRVAAQESLGQPRTCSSQDPKDSEGPDA
jgi:hypothetical protein